MATWWKSQQGEGEYSLQFETHSKKSYKLVEKAAQMAVDGKTVDDIAEVRRGEWKRYMTGNGWDYWEDLICPFCEKKHEKPRCKMNFCPNCGAKMDGERKE